MGTDLHDPGISKILQLVCQLIAYDPVGDIEQGANINGILERLTAFVERHTQPPTPQIEKSESVLRDNEERFRAAFMNANVGVALSDMQGYYIKVNDALCWIFGYSRDELERMTYHDLTYDEDREATEEVRQRVIVGESSRLRIIKRYVHKDGHIVWADVSSALLRDAAGQPLYFITHVQDITSQKLAEEALRASEANARAFQAKLKELQQISLELTAVESAEELCRRAIELGHNVLGYDRLGLLLFDNAEKSRVSRFGIESTGELRVQTGMDYKVEEDFAYNRLTRRGDIYVNEDTDLGDFEGIPVGRGWNVLVGLWDAQASLGWLAADNFFTKKPLIPYQVELLTLYGLTLGHLVTRKRAEAALRQSEFFLQKSQTIGQIGSYYLDAKTGNWISSPMLDTLFGIDEGFPKNLEGWISLIHPEHQEEMRRYFGQYVLAEHHRFDKDYRIIRQNNQQECWVHGFGELEFDQQGNVLAMIGTIQDITESKLAEETLQRSERKYRMLFENMTAGFALHEVIYDDRGQPVDFRHLEVNPAYEKITGNTASEVIGKTLTEMMPGTQPSYIAVCIKVVQTGEPIAYENYVEAVDRYYDTRIFCPAPGQFAVTFVDITERRRAEAALLKLNQELEQRVRERTAELETANEEIKNFAYIVSHDLRAPLVNLKGFSAELRAALKAVNAGCVEILPLVDEARRDTMTRALQEDIPEALQYIESSVTRMDGFIKAILRLSRLGRQPFELVEVDVRAIVDKTLDTLAFQINSQNVRVTIGSLPTVIGDRVSLEQIFGNILTNAVAYLLPERPGQIEISGEQTARETSFSVRDNGRGIAQDDMGNVFAPFRRAGKQDVPGEGMGMAYVQTLVRRHGGRIWCESELGVGTTFTFTISRRLKMDGDQA